MREQEEELVGKELDVATLPEFKPRSLSSS
jgi:hypothetical protein